MANISFFSGEKIPLEMHKVRIVQKLNLPHVERRLAAINEAGNNTFLLKNEDIFLDMLTDSGVNAMSDNQLASMMVADDSYAGSATFTRLESKVNEIFGTKYFLPAHQGRACEHILAQVYVKPGNVIPMNFHFTTPKAHITRMGGRVEELVIAEGPANRKARTRSRAILISSGCASSLKKKARRISPLSVLKQVPTSSAASPSRWRTRWKSQTLRMAHGIMTVLDASLWQDNLYFIKQREGACRNMTTREITLELAGEHGYHLLLCPQAGLCARRRHLHALQGNLHADDGARSHVRRLSDLRRHECA